MNKASGDGPLLQVENLSVAFRDRVVAQDINFSIGRGETLALVGESGSGKSVTALSILKLLPPAGHHPSGRILFQGEDLMKASPNKLREVRGDRIAMIFQEPMTSLNPLHRIERQLIETLTLHRKLQRGAARKEALELLKLVQIGDAEKRMSAFPHELSGGQRQRVMIAMALANNPDLLIADEPTTAVDVTIQAQLFKLLLELQRELGMAILLITHDLGLVRNVAREVCVMQNGVIVERSETETLFRNPQHPYTRHLLAAQPQPKGELRTGGSEIMSAKNLKVWFPIKAGVLRRVVGHVKAVDGIDIDVREGETIGIVGESGSGKTTLALGLLRLVESEGAILFMGRNIEKLKRWDLRPVRREMQIVFQDPYGSLSPRLSVGEIVSEGLDVHGLMKDEGERDAAVVAALKEVGLDPETRHRYPHEFSGGQRQRIAVARALILKPKLIVLDEPTSALDMSVQAQIVDLLRDLQKKHGFTYFFISHDLRVIRAMSDRVIVMRNGKVVEKGTANQIFEAPQEDYTKALLAAALHMEVAHLEAIRQ
ncbi:ABC transporter ATP-binding protein [Dongia deserti]|uniref:ABC transporter ATP-binding protein n=1 Tax=Dongia deserti TaxID=2268030 RepID=UPI000E65A134|nr:ABC transporter ATP-binding protein [Dongia deserti]